MRTKALALGLAAIFAVSCSDSATSPTSLNDAAPAPSLGVGPVVHHVSVGGADLCQVFGGQPPGCDANFSLVATLYADGSVKGQWQDTWFGRGTPALPIHVELDCLYVSGNDAWVSGVISSPYLPPLEVITRVADNGTSKNDPPDQIGFLNIEETDCTSAPELQLFDLLQGQVTVR